jgi:hypothetical protein
MNIHPLTAAAENLDAALVATINPDHRREILICLTKVQALLRKHVVFIGLETVAKAPKPKVSKVKTTADGKRLTKALIKSLQQTYRTYPMAGIREITDDGEAFIGNITTKPSPCGCRIVGNGTLQFPLTIAPCVNHQ